MKNDQGKPKGSSFYWDGLAKMSHPEDRAIIRLYQAFVKNPKLTELQNLFDIIVSHPSVNQEVINQLMHAYDHGSIQYGDKNYLELDIQRFIDAMGRHLVKSNSKFHDSIDKDSGYFHISHVLANILIAAELITK